MHPSIDDYMIGYEHFKLISVKYSRVLKLKITKNVKGQQSIYCRPFTYIFDLIKVH